MDCLNKNDVTEIIEMLEDELNVVPKLTVIEKMRMRSKIRRQNNWLLDFRNPTLEGIFAKLDQRLSEVFNSCPYGFLDDLKEKLEEKLAQLQIRKDGISSFMGSCHS